MHNPTIDIYRIFGRVHTEKFAHSPQRAEGGYDEESSSLQFTKTP